MRLKLAILFAFALGCTLFGFVAPCHADGSAVLSPSVTSGIASVVSAPIDPVVDPAGYVSELAAAKAQGWAALLMVLVFGLCELAAAGGKRADVPWLAWLGKGRISILIGGGVAVSAAAIAAMASSGTWVAAGYAAIGGLLLYLHPAAVDVALKQTAKKMASAAASGALVVALLALASCNPNGPGPVVANSVIDCTGDNAAKVATLFADFKAKLSGGGSWALIEADAKSAGMAVGGCALAELVQDYLGGKGAPASGDSRVARATLEDFRSTVAGGASFKTTSGKL